VADPQTPQSDHGQGLQEALLAAVADGRVLLGNVTTLAAGFDVSVAEFRTVLRALLEVRQIAVFANAHGQLTVRLERRVSQAPPPMVDRRRWTPDEWTI